MYECRKSHNLMGRRLRRQVEDTVEAAVSAKGVALNPMRLGVLKKLVQEHTEHHGGIDAHYVNRLVEFAASAN